MALTSPSMSPAIVVREFDLTGVAPNVETSLSAFVGRFKWGPVDVPTRIGNENQLAETFGIPDETHAPDYFSCNQFLRYSGNLIVTRTTPQGTPLYDARNAHGGDPATTVLVKNDAHFDSQFASLTGSSNFVAKYPGELGNSIKVSYFGVGMKSDGVGGFEEDSEGSANHLNNFLNWTYNEYFDAVPGSSVWAGTRPGTVKNDEIHLVVVDSDGLISGTKGTVLETWPFLSVAPAAKTTDGGDNYVRTVLNNASNYVRFTDWDSSSAHGDNWGTNPPSNGAGMNYATGYTWKNDFTSKDSSATVYWNADSDGGDRFVSAVKFQNGQDHSLLTTQDYVTAFEGQYADVEEIDIQMIIAPGMSSRGDQRTVVNSLNALAEKTRKDCVVVTSPPREAVVNQSNPTDKTLAFVNNGIPSSSYLIIDNNWLRVYDKYNDEYIYVPAASTTAGIMALTDYEYGPWWSPAGERRGEYFGQTSLAYSPSKSERDELYKKGVNPIVTFPGRGTILFGDKTRLTRPSAFDRINVRRLFLAIEKSISEAARNFLFEFNDEFTRSEFVAVVEPLLREIQARRGITDFFVQCDERNNTPEVIDRNEMVATMFIKPARSINFITLNFVATRTGADFEEIIQSGIQF